MWHTEARNAVQIKLKYILYFTEHCDNTIQKLNATINPTTQHHLGSYDFISVWIYFRYATSLLALGETDHLIATIIQKQRCFQRK